MTAPAVGGTGEAAAAAGGPLWRRATVFVAIALALYAVAVAASEYLVYRHGHKNRFFVVATTPAGTAFDHAILGASHAMPLDFEDMNRQIEAMSGARIVNLSMEGAGILPNRLILDYFLARHRTRNVLYVLDSFAFYSAQWNEQRVVDAALMQRAPLDLDLARVLWRQPWARPLLPGYLTGFAKVNNHNRLEPDMSDAERTLFRRTYRPIAFLDRQRLAYLYPPRVDPAAVERYLGAFRDLIRAARAAGAAVTAVKPPLPPRVIALIPGETAFDARIKALLEEEGAAFHDFSGVSNRDAFFYNTDHLNRDGVLAFAREHLAPLLARAPR